jgi:hypothetical protein
VNTKFHQNTTSSFQNESQRRTKGQTSIATPICISFMHIIHRMYNNLMNECHTANEKAYFHLGNGTVNPETLNYWEDGCLLGCCTVKWQILTVISNTVCCSETVNIYLITRCNIRSNRHLHGPWEPETMNRPLTAAITFKLDNNKSLHGTRIVGTLHVATNVSEGQAYYCKPY